MSKGLTLEQMKFLVGKGLSAEEMIAFAEMGAVKSKAAERTARWRAKKYGNVTESVTRDGHGDASPPPIEDHTPPISPNGENRAKRVKAVPAAKPEDVSDKVWTAWLDHRKRKGGTFTDVALDGMRREAVKAGWALEAAMSKALERNWQGFDAEWVKGSPAQGQTNGKSVAAAYLARHGPP